MSGCNLAPPPPDEVELEDDSASGDAPSSAAEHGHAEGPDQSALSTCTAAACDDFDRAVASGLGSGLSGAWWVEADRKSWVSGRHAHIEPPPSRSAHARLQWTPASADYRVSALVRLQQPAAQQAYVVARYQANSARADFYMAGWNGSAWVIRKRVGGSLSGALATFSGPPLVAGDWHRVELEVRGTQVRMRAWRSGAATPSQWATTADGSVPGKGAVGLRAYSFSNLAADVPAEFDGLTVTTLSQPPIALDINFSQGSLDVQSSKVSGLDVRLVGRNNENPASDRWKWIYFRASHVGGRTPTFRISSNFEGGSGRLTSHQMVYSYDRRTWRFFDHNTLDAQQGEFRFHNDAPFSAGAVYVAYGLPYPFERGRGLVRQAQASSFARKTASGNSDWSVGPSAGGVDDLGRMIPAHPLYAFQISDYGVPATGKKRVVLAGGVHSNETTGSHALHGLVKFLLGNDPAAVRLRKKAIIYVYPVINPDGRRAGYNRNSVEQVGEDPNRQWSSSLWGNNQEIRSIAQAMRADTGGDVDVFLDFHSTVGTGSHYAYLDVDGSPTGRRMAQTVLWQAITAREPLVAKDATFAGATAMRYGWANLRAEFSTTVEMYFRPGENVSRLETIGVNFGRALDQAL